MRTVNPIDSLRQDLKYGVRQLRMKPGFALAAVVSLALGIGANTAFFTMVDQILLRLLPVHNPRELVQLRVEGGRFGSNSGDGQHTFSHPTYLALRDRNTVFSGLTGQLIEQASLIGEERSEMIGVALVAGTISASWEFGHTPAASLRPRTTSSATPIPSPCSSTTSGATVSGAGRKWLARPSA